LRAIERAAPSFAVESIALEVRDDAEIERVPLAGWRASRAVG
jgi:hypothetical protein